MPLLFFFILCIMLVLVSSFQSIQNIHSITSLSQPQISITNHRPKVVGTQKSFNSINNPNHIENNENNAIISFLLKSISLIIIHMFWLVVIPNSSFAKADTGVAMNQNQILKSDELQVEIDSDFLGLSLKEIKNKFNNDLNLVLVNSIKPEADTSLKQLIKPGMIMVAIGDNPVEGLTGKDVVSLFKSITKPTFITFRDPNLFFEKLDSSKLIPSNIAQSLPPIVTSSAVQPSISTASNGDASTILGVKLNNNKQIINTRINYNNQDILTIQRLNLNQFKPSPAHAQIGDVLEVAYTLQVDKSNDDQAGSGIIFSRAGQNILDSSGLTSSSSSSSTSSSSSSFFFVLGRPLPTNLNLPLGFDIGLQGMCIGEKRRINLPATLGYDSIKKFENVYITPTVQKTVVVNKFQPLLLDVLLVSINGVAEAVETTATVAAAAAAAAAATTSGGGDVL